MKIESNCGFPDDASYLGWFKDSLEELFEIEPLIPSYFIRKPLSGLLSSDADQDQFVLSIPELQEFALDLLKKYLHLIDNDDWSASKAFDMSDIQYDESETTLPEANEVLYETMVNHFEKFSSEIPLFFEHKGHYQVGYVLSFAFWDIFKDKDEFGQLIWQEKYNQALRIDKVRDLWQLFKANGYHNVQFDTKKQLNEDEMLEYAMSCLTLIENVSREVDESFSDWEQISQTQSVDAIEIRIKKLYEELANNPLKIEQAITYQMKLKNLLDQIQKA